MFGGLTMAALVGHLTIKFHSLGLLLTVGKVQDLASPLHREIVPPRETVATARVAIAIVGRAG